MTDGGRGHSGFAMLLLTRGREQPQGDGFWRQDLGRLGDWTTSSLVPDGSRVLVAPAARWSGRRLTCRDLARACAGRDRGKVSSPTDKWNGGFEIGPDLAAKL